jgi:hypothetical protein
MEKKAIKEAQNFLKSPEISIWLDNYNDVFSEFDSRPFSDRALSDDFLREVHKMVTERSGEKVEIKFHILGDERNPESEGIIINNINSHFKSIANALKSEKQHTLNKGYMLLASGFVLISFLFYLSRISVKGDYLSGVYLMLEPLSWFITWTGLDHVFQISKSSKAALDFNSKMGYAGISFSSLADVNSASDTRRVTRKTVIPFDNDNLRVA